MSQLGLEKGKGAALFLRRQQAAEQSALIKEGEASKSDAINTTRSTFQDPLDNKSGIVRRSSFKKNSIKEKTPEPHQPETISESQVIPSNETVIKSNDDQEEEPKVTTKPPIASRKPPTAAKSSSPRLLPQTIPGKQASGHSITEQKDTGSIQIQKPIPPPKKDEISEPIHGEVVTNIGNTLNKVADKLSALKTKSIDHDDEENVFLDHKDSSRDSTRMEDNEIVYDDPGSVKDIRKKFGVRTNPEFAQPRGPVLSGRNSRSGSIVQNDSLNSSFSGPSESPKRNSQRYSTEADKIFQEAIIAGETQPKLPPPPSPKNSPLPPRPKPKPKPKKMGSASSLPNYMQQQNSDILSRLADLEKETCSFDSFEAAVSDFYMNVKSLDSSIVNPSPVNVH